MEGVIVYVTTPPTNPTVAENMIKIRAEEQIQKDKLRVKVPEELRDDLIFYSLSPYIPPVPVAAITGIAIGAALVGLIAGRMLVRRKVRRKDRRGEQYDGLNGPAGSGEMTMDDDEFGCKSGDSHSPLSFRSIKDDNNYNMQEMSVDNSVASSSCAGSSGWSSSAGMSSLNTASVDSAEYFGSSLAAISAASNISKKYRKSPASMGEEMYPVVSDGDQSSMSER